MSQKEISKKLKDKLEFIAHRTYCNNILHLTADNIDSNDVNSIKNAVLNAMELAISEANKENK